ncbi:MAG: hypothetical protein IJH63_10490 [Methanobrevibacter sp.]|nr:hypothetical protein [Methanosphaera sp.]MBR0371128.1 hypothetical protein [Methanobrevibacter sp.]
MTTINEISNIITGMYDDHLENGADLINLYYNDEKEELVVCVRCTDDAYPYWIESEPLTCTLREWSIILYEHFHYIVGGGLCDEGSGKKYPVTLEWDY